MSFTIDLKLNELSNIPKQTKQFQRRVIVLSKNELIRNLKIETPVDKGRARGSWFMNKYSDDEISVKSSVAYMKFLNDGTGIYGPKGRKIRPTGKKVLVFEYNGKTVYAKSVKGMKPLKIVEKSIKTTKTKIPGIGRIAGREVLK